MADQQNIIEADALVIGGGVAGLSFGIHLADLIAQFNSTTDSKLPLNIIILEKGAALGSHNLSGAVVNPSGLKVLLPQIDEKDFPFESPVTKDEFYHFLTPKLAIKLPFTPPFMGNHGNYVASLGKIVRFLGEIAEQKGVQIYSGFSVSELLYGNGKIIGAKTIDTGVDKHGKPMDNYQPGDEIRAKLVILAEGSRGSLTTQWIRKHELAGFNPQVYSTGVKELWEVPEGTFGAGHVIHTLGYPFDFNHFGGGFIYGVSNRQVAVGIAAALDYTDPTFDPHAALQLYKKHPMIAKILEKGRILKYGAKTIPEGGLFSLPRLYHNNVMVVGDSAGFLSMPSLKGIHLAIESGMLAAQTAFESLKKNDFSSQALSLYEELFKKSAACKDLNRVRNFRAGFGCGMIPGAFHFAMQILTGGRGITPSGKIRAHEDAVCYKKLADIKNPFQKKFASELHFDKRLTFDKVTDVFYSGSKHDEEQPCHCKVLDIKLCRDVCIPKYGGPCQHFCPAEVYEIVTDPKTGKKDLHLHPANCVHCKTCDIKDPFGNLQWTVPYGGDGPEYDNL